MTKIISWVAVILWMALIFYFSQQQATSSNELSTGITGVIIPTVEKIAPDMDADLGGFNHIVRKNAHFLIYLVFGVLVINALRRRGVHGYYRGIVQTILICALYAISDEVHQLFVNGRGPQVKDVFIDSAGAIVGISLFCLINWILNKKDTR